MEQLETAQRRVGCSFDIGGMPDWGKLRAFHGTIGDSPAAGWLFLRHRRHAGLGQAKGLSMEQLETAQRRVGCSFDIGGMPDWGKLRAFHGTIGDSPAAGWLFLRHRRHAGLGQAKGFPWNNWRQPRRLTGCSFGVSGVPFRGKLKAQEAGSSLRRCKIVG